MMATAMVNAVLSIKGYEVSSNICSFTESLRLYQSVGFIFYLSILFEFIMIIYD